MGSEVFLAFVIRSLPYSGIDFFYFSFSLLDV